MVKDASVRRLARSADGGKPFRTAIAQPQEPQQPQGASIPTGAAPADEIEERAAWAADRLPAVYLDAWARLQCQRPLTVLEDVWRRAVNDAGLFLDEWGREAAEWRWTAGELFDVLRDGRPGGLIWFIQGECLWGLGPEYAVLRSGEHVFDKTNAAASGSAVHKGGCDDARAYQGRAESSR
jgi:hypothetical protein